MGSILHKRGRRQHVALRQLPLAAVCAVHLYRASAVGATASEAAFARCSDCLSQLHVLRNTNSIKQRFFSPYSPLTLLYEFLFRLFNLHFYQILIARVNERSQRVAHQVDLWRRMQTSQVSGGPSYSKIGGGWRSGYEEKVCCAVRSRMHMRRALNYATWLCGTLVSMVMAVSNTVSAGRQRYGAHCATYVLVT